MTYSEPPKIMLEEAIDLWDCLGEHPPFSMVYSWAKERCIHPLDLSIIFRMSQNFDAIALVLEASARCISGGIVEMRRIYDPSILAVAEYRVAAFELLRRVEQDDHSEA